MIYQPPVRSMMFLLDALGALDRVLALPGCEDLGREDVEFILEEAGKFCCSELLPINQSGDEHGVRFEAGDVFTPPGFKQAYRAFVENGWSIIDADPAHGGQGLPRLLQFLVSEMLGACNLSFKLYTELSAGAYHLLASTASDAIRERCLQKMVAGAWSGTMCLTEPHCGTDLGLLRTAARDNGDGTYAITGTKIFITSGDHDLTDNILHMVLARLEGAPEGTRGISLFLVPKFLVDSDGGVGPRNGVSTGSLEHKMGIRGSATCVLNFDDATGYLIGEANRGLAAMFEMMNIERLVVGTQGLGIAEIACQNARQYAQERLQSRAPRPRPAGGKAADPIIYQPDIKRKLLSMRAQIEGARALLIFTGMMADVQDKSTDAEAGEEARDLVALLTPVVKSFLSDLGVSCALTAQQVYGGHGYIREHGMEQLVRDARIAPIYEGTNEVQAVDLVTRKLAAGDGRLPERLFAHLERLLEGLQEDGAGREIMWPARAAFERLRGATAWIREQEPAVALGAATAYQRMFGLDVIACLWAPIVTASAGGEGIDDAAWRYLAAFYMANVLPEAAALHEIMVGGAESLAAFPVEGLIR